MKKLMLSLLLAMPMVASAAGMGIYIPLSVANSSSETISYDSSFIADQDVDYDYDPSLGFGLAFDSNIGKDKLFNYRLGLEYMKVNVDNRNGIASDNSYLRYNIVNTFGFGVLRTKNVRLWVGPRINVAWSLDTGDYGYTDLGFELGVAPAVGVNINLGPVVSLAADIDYRFAYVAGAFDSDGLSTGGTYSGSATGPTARFYVLFRFGEEFQKQAPQVTNQGVIDQSL